MLLKIKQYQIFIPCGIISLIVLPLILLYRVESVKVVNIELNTFPEQYVFTIVTPTRSIIHINDTTTIEQIIYLSDKIKRSNDTSIVYQIPLSKLNKYKELIKVLDALQRNKIAFYFSDNLLVAWLWKPESNYYQLSHYLDVVRVPNGLENDVVLRKYSLWEELAMQSWSDIIQDKLFWLTTVVVIGWLLLFGVSFNNSIQIIKSRRLTSRST
jgi:hypothetical protein